MSPPRETAGSSNAAPARDFYAVLSVPRTASGKEIRRAYRALARKYHPDFNPGDETAAQKFREVHDAYEILGNATRRKAYDYYGPDFGDRIPKRAPETRRPAAEPPPSPSRERDSERAAPRPSASRGPFVFYRSPDVYPRLASRAQFASLTAVAVFVFGTLFYFMLPDPGVREFQRAQEALRHVASWKTARRTPTPDAGEIGYLTEVSCPSSEQTTRYIRVPSTGFTNKVFKTILIGNDSYAYSDWSQSWSHAAVAGAAASYQCAALQRGQDAMGLPPLSRWITDSSRIEKQSLRDAPDGKCREWKIVTFGAISRSAEAEYVCLGVKDHLPRFQGFPGSPQEVQFYDWNVPIQIVAPDLSAAP